jgi:glycosyltransferase involved in cell wall biosynthesis
LSTLLDIGFDVDIVAEGSSILKNLPYEICDRVRVFCDYYKSNLPKITYLRLIDRWIEVKRLRKLANTYDIIFNVRGGNLYDPPPSSSKTVIYYLYDPMITHIYSYRKYSGPIMRFYFTLLDNIFVNRCNKNVILANSYYSKRILAAKNIASHVVYPPCKIDDLFSSIYKKNQVVSVGRISVEKGHEVTLEIARYFPKIDFIILGELGGDIAYYNKLRKLQTSNVKIITPSHEKFRKLMRLILSEAKIYIHSCDCEAFGMTIVEAMASGCVPVVRDAAGPREIITPESGFLWKSVSQAVKHIARILSNEKLRQKLSLNAIQRAKKFDIPAYQKRLMEIIRQYS